MYALKVHARDISNKAEADAVLAQCKAVGITDIIYQLIDDDGHARYNTNLFTKCPDTGTFDPLGYLASASGVKVHAWLSVGVDVLYAHPEWSVRITRELSSTYPSWSDFTRADVRQFCADWCASIAQAYPTVGIHLDYLRWDVKFGGDKLSWATAASITQTFRAIAAAIPDSMITAAVGTNPLGTTSGSLQAWGDWMDILNMAVVLAYPGSTAELRTLMARSAAINKNKVAIGLSGLYFQYNPYRETRLSPSVLADCVNWARSAGYKHFSWFDYTKINAEQYATIAQLSSADGQVGPVLLRPSVLTLSALAVFGLAAWRFRRLRERERPGE
jgi:hypothetical protein